ncbi:YitT family protein [Clostridium omnivorum]|uniref:Membrane protein n=1 Tax=Clostridium omnivorum TaxID=1604902 RepID=A0ABQ5NA88_9CLOT|nr:YitT family protein [Clostridium sp. E14]GLC32002.1 membrane protein [Clostridium sp. E14]
MRKIDIKKIIADYFFVLAGCILVAFAISSILKPSGLVTGGITGISIIFEKLTGIKYTYIYYVLSLLVLLTAFITMGKREGFKIITLSVLFPLILIIFENLNISFIKNDMMLSSVYFGIVCGIGTGLMLKRGFSSGGTDTIAKILHKKIFTFVGLSEILLCIDATIIATSAIVYNLNVALYAIISQIISMKLIDLVMFGFDSKKVKIEIISDKHEEITQYILHQIVRGVTSCEIRGGYMNATRLKLQTICSPREAMLIKRFISDTDSDAFVNVVPVISVWGKGIGFDSLVEEK